MLEDWGLIEMECWNRGMLEYWVCRERDVGRLGKRRSV